MNDAPRQLTAAMGLAMRALRLGQHGAALNELNKAHDLAAKNPEWRAEVAAAWAVYYYHTGDRDQMLHSMRYAAQLEPENERIRELKEALKRES